MWLVFKIKKKRLNQFREDLEKKIDKNFLIYSPKILIKKKLKTQEKNQELQLLDDYIFCYHSNFSDQKFLTKIKYCRGLKYFLTGYKLGQSEIKKFIDLCKSFENKDGFLNYDFFKIDLNKNYKILSGPFVGQIVKILNYQKNKIDLVLGNIKASINRENLLFKPV